MKRLDQVLDIGPKYAAQFEQNGIRNVIDLAKADNLPELSRRTEVPLELVQQWHERARQKVKASRYRRRIATWIAIVALLALGWEVRAFLQPLRISSQGNALYEKGDYEQAVERYDRVIELDPKFKFAYAHKGSVLRMLRRYPEAIAALDKAIELDPQYVWAYTERGNTYSDRGDHERAIVDYDKAIELDPTYKFAYSKAFDLSTLGRYKEAVDALNQAIAIDPQWTWAYEERGSIYHDDLFQYAAAYQDLKKVSELKDSQAGERADLAETALTSGRFGEAYDLASKLLAENENTNTNTFDVSDRLAVRFIAISALLLEGNTAQAKLKLEEFVRYYKSAAPALKRHWNYSGTRHFIAGRAMDGVSKRIILDLIKLLEQPPEIKIERIKELVSTLR